MEADQILFVFLSLPLTFIAFLIMQMYNKSLYVSNVIQTTHFSWALIRHCIIQTQIHFLAYRTVGVQIL